MLRDGNVPVSEEVKLLSWEVTYLRKSYCCCCYYWAVNVSVPASSVGMGAKQLLLCANFIWFLQKFYIAKWLINHLTVCVNYAVIPNLVDHHDKNSHCSLPWQKLSWTTCNPPLTPWALKMLEKIYSKFISCVIYRKDLYIATFIARCLQTTYNPQVNIPPGTTREGRKGTACCHGW